MFLYTCCHIGKGGRIPCFALLVPVGFALPIKLLLFQPMSSYFHLVIPSPFLPGWNKQAARLLAQVKSQHHKRIKLKCCSFRSEHNLKKVYSKMQKVLTFFLLIYYLLSTQTLGFLQDVTKTTLPSVSLVVFSALNVLTISRIMDSAQTLRAIHSKKDSKLAEKLVSKLPLILTKIKEICRRSIQIENSKKQVICNFINTL